ncbi:MAG: hypothetical protein GF397_06750 [Elusimicrobia bacterium]|nr:hypothetical protein [Elusimicrobiota bacterium]
MIHLGEKIKENCIFCGEKVKEKTREHVIPKWLIELTGPKKREIPISYFNEKGIKNLTIPFDKFSFPSCAKCNHQYSDLESSTKNIVLHILGEKKLDANDFDTLLHWFDKVRIGLWIGALIISGNPLDISPRFYIKNRVNLSDRALFIYKINDIKLPHLSFYGVNTPAFYSTPSVFGIFINNFYFVSISDAFLFSDKLGFPYPKKHMFSNGETYPKEFECGSHQINNNLFSIKYFDKCTEIYQTIIPNELIKEISNHCDMSYVNLMRQKNVFTDFKIYIKTSNQLNPYPLKKSHEWRPKEGNSLLKVNDIFKMVLKMQKYVIQRGIEKTIFPNEQKDEKIKYLRLLMKVNDKLMKKNEIIKDPDNKNRYHSRGFKNT